MGWIEEGLISEHGAGDGKQSTDDTNGADNGQAHLFSAATGLLLQTFNDPTPTAGDRFGVSVSVSEDNVLIGASFDDTNGNITGQAH